MHSIALILRRITQSFALLPPQSLRDSSPNNAQAFWGSIWKEQLEQFEQLELSLCYSHRLRQQSYHRGFSLVSHFTRAAGMAIYIPFC
ncbi:MAG: hypothetical protein IKP71_06300, partial [Candidatus Riflebacteria bacterium]|nr:hypothetical protein [Candidatus Riflebacteria bacterium]